MVDENEKKKTEDKKKNQGNDSNKSVNGGENNSQTSLPGGDVINAGENGDSFGGLVNTNRADLTQEELKLIQEKAQKDNAASGSVSRPSEPCFEVWQIGRNGSQSASAFYLMKNCCDEAEAIRLYCKDKGLNPNKRQFRCKRHVQSSGKKALAKK